VEHIALSVVLGGLTTIGVVTGAYGIFAERAARNNWVALQAAELEILRLREMIRERDQKALESDAAARCRLMEVDGDRIDLETRLRSVESQLNAMAESRSFWEQQFYKADTERRNAWNGWTVASNSLEHMTKEHRVLLEFMIAHCLVQRPKSKWFAKVIGLSEEGVELKKDARVWHDDVVKLPD